mmetsp:Transcript_695/g.1559  ORF Transcript_695/g.1559 Transcript_695/m.1559 type:complete len:243 (+) Transcript_695:1216-1944(+)
MQTMESPPPADFASRLTRSTHPFPPSWNHSHLSIHPLINSARPSSSQLALCTHMHQLRLRGHPLCPHVGIDEPGEELCVAVRLGSRLPLGSRGVSSVARSGICQVSAHHGLHELLEVDDSCSLEVCLSDQFLCRHACVDLTQDLSEVIHGDGASVGDVKAVEGPPDDVLVETHLGLHARCEEFGVRNFGVTIVIKGCEDLRDLLIVDVEILLQNLLELVELHRSLLRLVEREKQFPHALNLF